MSKPKVEIPAWQRAAQTKPSPAEDPVYSQPQHSEDDVQEVAVSSTEEAEAKAETATQESTSSSEEPAKQQNVVASADFDSFKQQQNTSQQATPSPAPAPPPQQQQVAAPPIITYPEFLVEAHKPPPLITPARVLNTLYAAGGLATLVHAASKYIITPMVDNLSESRHDFLSHSQSKVDELNDRLSKLVSQQPGARSAASEAGDDTDSETSDPTELYHRDMGTQTEAPPEPKPLISQSEEKKDHVEWATNGLKIMESHISEMADASDKAGESHKDRLEKMNNLRHYLDQLLYGTIGGPMWTEQSIQNAYGSNGTNGESKKEDDAVEELKKEIRGVKGVLLSAKRFPPVGRPVQAAS
ncbi:Putative peroxisomal membrane protein [Septoria linicola]|uniref:Peroxisomal membrane protein n=1 Tax=Septoria linicola TaxID=215465 RepID=A0A9Q9AXY5_9PEZI|nr:putative peroxisomal membrane protein [Septoria linicola]USW57454.1 Putative peroxisomal membrane protein [Septoria linicola]